jgi:small-conductance mechanosensitive channel
MDAWMKSGQKLIAIGLGLLVVSAIVGLFLTSDSTTSLPVIARNTASQEQLVDEKPLQTARTLGKLAIGPDEQQVADQAAHYGDDEVDLSFHDASRSAADHPPQKNPKFHELFAHASDAAAQVKTDQDDVDRLKKLVAAGGAKQASYQEQLDVAQAQLELDQDELNDAKEDLVRAGADPGSLIQRQFEQHQATEHGDDDALKTIVANTADLNYETGNLIAKFNTWRSLRDKASQLQQASGEAAQRASALERDHDSLEKQVQAEKSRKPAPTPAPTTVPATKSSPANAAPPTTDASSAVKSLHLISDDQKNLADLDKRIQDEQQLQTTYATWLGLVHAHERAVLHGAIQSLLWILVIVLAVYLVDRTIDHYLADKGEERTRLHTLRVVFQFGVQAIGALLVLLVIFGPPQQLATILGFAGAGLTVACKDFIVAFVGWFVLMGKNGLRVGDWVEINGVAGEVIEINLLRTVLLETGNWTDTGHPTGRKVAFVNSYAIEGHFFNFTTSGQWLWDELKLTLPSDRDPYALIDEIQKTVEKETEASVRGAEEEWKRVTSRYRVRSVSAAPAVNLRPTGSSLEVYIRYITRAHDRFAMRARLNQALVQLLRAKAMPAAQ